MPNENLKQDMQQLMDESVRVLKAQKSRLAQAVAVASANSRRLDNYRDGNPETFRLVQSESAVVPVPADAKRWARLVKMGGAVEEVKATGKNLLNLEGRTAFTTRLDPSDTLKSALSEDLVIVGFSSSGYVRNETIASWSVEPGRVTFERSTVSYAQSYGLGFPVRVTPGTYYQVSSTPSPQLILCSEAGQIVTNTTAYPVPEGIAWMIVRLPLGADYKTYVFDELQVEQSLTKSPYEPYKVVSSTPVPPAVLALPGYGTSGTYIDTDRKVFFDGSVERDISDILPEDWAFLDTEPGGSIAFEQSDGVQLPVPSTIEFEVSE